MSSRPPSRNAVRGGRDRVCMSQAALFLVQGIDPDDVEEMALAEHALRRQLEKAFDQPDSHYANDAERETDIDEIVGIVFAKFRHLRGILTRCIDLFIESMDHALAYDKLPYEEKVAEDGIRIGRLVISAFERAAAAESDLRERIVKALGGADISISIEKNETLAHLASMKEAMEKDAEMIRASLELHRERERAERLAARRAAHEPEPEPEPERCVRCNKGSRRFFVEGFGYCARCADELGIRPTGKV